MLKVLIGSEIASSHWLLELHLFNSKYKMQAGLFLN
jgi:hypothetical protein